MGPSKAVPFFFSLETGPHYIAQANFKLTILPPQPPVLT
jgi:hypothetical protein